MKKRKTGFTLIELLVVISIIAILTVAGIVSFSRASKVARDAKRKADLETVRQAMVQFKANREDPDNGDPGQYPNNSIGTPEFKFSSIVGELYDSGYLSTDDIKDPRSPTTDYSCVSCTDTGFTFQASLENDKDPKYPAIQVSNP
ncbi:MAG: hypothetical protein COY80_02570 [Candidatus Pacebacteria bacterium CG_4_10_14_0_8_um_filter_42_14]|nr:MAG: hypothetical protein COY80_02570 [Candidatus Pacebacteria bacterium CG_4_10_14_0_8_um_filter_42_14]